MPGSAARYALTPQTPAVASEALSSIVAAARRITRITPANAECAGLLARLSLQLAEATQAIENAAAREMIVADIYAAGQASRPPGRRHLAPVLVLTESAPRPPAPFPGG